MENLQQNAKKTIYRATNVKGVRSIWDWSEKKNNYTQRNTGNRYQASIERNGRAKSESFRSIQDATYWRNKMTFELERQPEFAVLTFKELLNKFFEHHAGKVSESTMKTYSNQINHFEFFDDYMVEDINFAVIDRWLKLIKADDYRSRKKMKTSRFSYIKEVKLLSLIFNFYKNHVNGIYHCPLLSRHKDDSIFDRNIYEKRKMAFQDRFMTQDQIEHFLDVFKRQADKKSEKYLYFVSALIQLRSGMRIGEVFALRWEDIDWVHGIYKIKQTALWRIKTQIGDAPKNRRLREIYLIKEVRTELKKLQLLQSRITGFIFSDDGIKIKGYSSPLHHYNCAFKAANIPFTATHINRHSFATDFRATIPDDNGALQGILGHSSQKQTAHYAKIISKTNVAALSAFEQAIEKRKT